MNTVRSYDWSKVEEALRSAARPFEEDPKHHAGKKNYVFPGAVLLVGRGGDVVFQRAIGCRSLVPRVREMNEETVFDIASVTKVLVTATLAMQLTDRGLLDIDRRLSHIFQTFGTHGKERMTVRHLLAHCSGYPATAPFYKQIVKADSAERAGFMTSRGAVEQIYQDIFRAKLENLPGKVSKYSDIGFILLGYAIETLNGAYLDKLAVRNVFTPLKLRSTGYIDLAHLRRKQLEPVSEVIAPTADCPWRGRVLCGEVHDDNAWAMGGVAPHAGIFSTAIDVHTFAAEMIRCYRGEGSLVSKDTVRRFWTRDGTVPDSTWALGWDTPTPGHSSSGKYFSSAAVGHLGFTGCSLWIDPERELDVVLLSNRIHPSTHNNSIQTFRPHIHDLVMEALGFV